MRLSESESLTGVSRIVVHLYGSLGATGRGHGSDKAVVLGLEGDAPETVDVEGIDDRIALIRQQQTISVLGEREIAFDHRADLIFEKRESLPWHPNGMRFVALTEDGSELLSRIYYSVGGGFVVSENNTDGPVIAESSVQLAFPFISGEELLAHCEANAISISELMLKNELAWRDESEIRQGLIQIWDAMQACVEKGCRTTGLMPGLKVKRRAADHYQQLINQPEAALRDPADYYGLGQCIRLGGQRRKRSRRTRRYRSDEWRRRNYSCRTALLPALLRQCIRRRRGPFSVDRWRCRPAVQTQCIHQRCRSRLSGRSRFRLLYGGCRTDRSPWRQPVAG